MRFFPRNIVEAYFLFTCRRRSHLRRVMLWVWVQCTGPHNIHGLITTWQKEKKCVSLFRVQEQVYLKTPKIQHARNEESRGPAGWQSATIGPSQSYTGMFLTSRQRVLLRSFWVPAPRTDCHVRPQQKEMGVQKWARDGSTISTIKIALLQECSGSCVIYFALII